jgi:3-deoxy-D-manno-octulosonate 8-phosphate phosphatase (KDO 8-P phosphatase)
MPLSPEQATEKARRVRMVIMDVDGVLTDGRVFYGGDVQGVQFNVHDGTGIKYLHRGGIRTGIITGRSVRAVLTRAEDLGIEHVVQGAKVKLDAYDAIAERTGLPDECVAFVCDDLTDIPVLRRVGFAVTVPNAAAEVLQMADHVTEKCGGEGAVRELAEFILKAQGKWADILARYLPERKES